MASSLLVYISVAVLLINFSVPVFPRIHQKEPYNFRLVPRDGWNALPSTDKRLLTLPAPYVVVHHTYIPAACYTLEECARAMRSMQRQHINSNWGDIGYNFCVGAEGTAFEGRGWNFRGIHAGVANGHSVGICLIGDWREKLPPRRQIDTLRGLIEAGVRLGKIRKDYKLIGHLQVSSTECPGGALMAEFSKWKHFTPGRPDFRVLMGLKDEGVYF